MQKISSNNNKIKVAIDVRALGEQRTGDEVYTRELVNQLKEDETIHLHLLFRKGQKAPCELTKKESITIHYIASKQRGLWLFWNMPKALKKINPHILHTQYTTPQWFSPMPKTIKLITTVHDIGYKHHPSWIQLKDRILWGLFLGPSLRKADHVISVSETTKQDILHFFPAVKKENITTIHNGIEKRYKKTTKAEEDKVREKYNLPEKFLLYLGTLQPRKNIPYLLKEYQTYKEKTAKAIALVVAGKQYGKNYDENIEQCNHDGVMFPGYIDEEDKPALYSAATLFVWPSRYEGFGLPPVEALYCETPVIALENSCHKEILQQSATIITKKPSLFAKTITKVLKEKKETVPPTYSWKKNAQETVQLYKSLRQHD